MVSCVIIMEKVPYDTSASRKNSKQMAGRHKKILQKNVRKIKNCHTISILLATKNSKKYSGLLSPLQTVVTKISM